MKTEEKRQEVDDKATGTASEGSSKKPLGAGPVATESIGPLSPGQRWTAGRKREVVLRMLRGESMEGLSRELRIEVHLLEKWRQKAMRGLDKALQNREGDPLQVELDQAMQRIGELSMENELLREKDRQKHPLAYRRSRK